MKKIANLLSKRRQKTKSFNHFCDTPFSESVTNDIVEKNVHKYYQFDFDCYNIHESEDGIELESRAEATEVNKLHESPSQVQDSLSNSGILKFSDADLLDTEPGNNLKPLESDLLNLDFPKSSSDPESFSLCKQKGKCQSENNKKSSKNIYVININNSKNFHIGSQKTINYNNNKLSRVPVQGYKAQHCVDNLHSEIKPNWNLLFDCKMKLSEDNIILISLNLSDQWKKFVKSLGLQEIFLKLVEARNDCNRTLTVYDALQKYIRLYPNTTLGFIIYLLNEIQEITIIEKLALEIKPA